ncbi:DUF2861 family protein [Vibrio harveyi]|uniref:DUF2861 family protein n=1 Tax=Vibrio harveyi TaxID=669 RepID=UPI003BB6A04B
MTRVCKRLLFALAGAGTVLSTYAHANLFTVSPLEHAYQATLTHQPQLAWQELFLALRQNEISSKYWVPIKNELLSQTACGTELSSGKKLTSQLTLGVIRRFGLTSQGYQIRLSVEQYTKNQSVTLTSPNGVALLKGNLIANPQYQEVESIDLLQKPVSGIYTLSLGNQKIDLLIAIPEGAPWLSLGNKEGHRTVETTLPSNVSPCPKAMATWQWFDKNYNLLGSTIPFTHSLEGIPKQPFTEDKAEHLTASVELVEFQNGVQIEYIQRLAIPYR